MCLPASIFSPLSSAYLCRVEVLYSSAAVVEMPSTNVLLVVLKSFYQLKTSFLSLSNYYNHLLNYAFWQHRERESNSCHFPFFFSIFIEFNIYECNSMPLKRWHCLHKYIYHERQQKNRGGGGGVEIANPFKFECKRCIYFCCLVIAGSGHRSDDNDNDISSAIPILMSKRDLPTYLLYRPIFFTV